MKMGSINMKYLHLQSMKNSKANTTCLIGMELIILVLVLGTLFFVDFSAHGRIGDKKTFAVLEPYAYSSQCESMGHGIKKFQNISEKDIQKELLVFGLRCVDGVEMKIVNDCIQSKKLDKFLRDGFLYIEGTRLKPSLKGLQVMDTILTAVI
jgi:coproporphyrinogen III oxidase-like Fe-S oxidoreductase